MNPSALVVEDDKPISVLLGHILRRAGYDVDFALNGQDAIAKLTAKEYTLVTLDAMMPMKNGFEVCDYLRRQGSPTIDNVIMVTASPWATRKAAEEYRLPVLTKPFDLSEMTALATQYRTRNVLQPA